MNHLQLKDQIKSIAIEVAPEVIKIRRHLHQHPELSFHEYETSKYIAQQLDHIGVDYETDWANTGIVAYLKGANPTKRTIALRADIDALPILEENDVPYKSINEGVMHACGHDVHTSSLLGVIMILKRLQEHIEGTIRFIFQPAEENFPGGASLMIEEGVLKDPEPAFILGQHVHPSLESGKVGIRPGKFMASADELFLTITGSGGHGALPHDTVDPVLITSHLIVALQQLVSRRIDPTLPAVLTIGKIESEGGSTNVIPDRVKLKGTFRTLDESWRKKAHVLMKQLAHGLVESMGGKLDLDIKVGYPYLENNPGLTLSIKEAMIDFLGKENVVDLPLRMSAEDFAYYSQVVPACFYRLGTGNLTDKQNRRLHTTTFDIDESALELSIGLMSWLSFIQ